MTDDEFDAYTQFGQAIADLRQLICEHLPLSWFQVTLETSCRAIANELCQITMRFKQTTARLDSEASASFQPDSRAWLPAQIMDVRGIAVSFRAGLSGDGLNRSLRHQISLRIESVTNFLNECENLDDKLIPVGTRIFSPIPVMFQSWRLRHEDLEETALAGEGGSARVYRGFDKRTEREVAIKKLNFTRLADMKLRNFQREVRVLATAVHPCIVKFIGATDSAPFCIVTEWMRNGSLYQELHEDQALNPTQRTIAAFDIARGMEYLHSHHIIHRDLKSLNVLFDSEHSAHICDFGLSRHEDESSLFTHQIGTTHWMAPEILSSLPYDKSVDVYSYGIVLWEILTGSFPYLHLDHPQVAFQVIKGLRPALPETAPPALRALIERCWAQDPSARPTFSGIIDAFRRGQVFLPGCDHRAFFAHLAATLPDLPPVPIDDDVPDSDISARLDDLKRTVDAGHPIPEAERLAHRLSAALDLQLLVRGADLLIRGGELGLAGSLLYGVPPGMVPPETITAAVERLPTGSVDVDRAIVIAACRNGAADYVSVVVTDPVLRRLALEVVAVQGVDEKMKISVIDRCNCCLRTGDSLMMCSALRCLAGIGELSRTPPSVIYRILAAEPRSCPQLCNCCYPAIIALANSGKLDPDMAGSAAKDIARVLIERAVAGDPLAATALVGGCSDVKFGFLVLNMVNSAPELPAEVVVRMLLVIAKAGGPNVALNILEEWNGAKFAVWHTEFPRVQNVLRKLVDVRSGHQKSD
jgi:tRNA A-37 threonylcarbamoyl transferase component Bud32